MSKGEEEKATGGRAGKQEEQTTWGRADKQEEQATGERTLTGKQRKCIAINVKGGDCWKCCH